jgi:hypothetical protein
MNDVIVEAIYKLGNNETIKKKCEPNIMRRLSLETWMIERTLYCISLLQEEWDNERLRTTNNGRTKSLPKEK